MSIWSKLNTLLRATAHEPVEHLVDANAIRIFEQEIRDAENAIVQAKYQLATVMAEKKQLLRHNQALAENIAVKEQQAVAALTQNKVKTQEKIANLTSVFEGIYQIMETALEIKGFSTIDKSINYAAGVVCRRRYRRACRRHRRDRDGRAGHSPPRGGCHSGDRRSWLVPSSVGSGWIEGGCFHVSPIAPGTLTRVPTACVTGSRSWRRRRMAGRGGDARARLRGGVRQPGAPAARGRPPSPCTPTRPRCALSPPDPAWRRCNPALLRRGHRPTTTPDP